MRITVARHDTGDPEGREQPALRILECLRSVHAALRRPTKKQTSGLGGVVSRTMPHYRSSLRANANCMLKQYQRSPRVHGDPSLEQCVVDVRHQRTYIHQIELLPAYPGAVLGIRNVPSEPFRPVGLSRFVQRVASPFKDVGWE